MLLRPGVRAQAPAQPGAGLLQQRRAFLAVVLAPHDLSPLRAGAPFGGHLEASPAAIDPAPPIGQHPAFLSLPARAESHGEEQVSAGIVAVHISQTRQAAGRLRSFADVAQPDNGLVRFPLQTTEEGENMGIGVALILIAVGAVIAFATTATTIGWIILAVGVFGIVVSLIFWSSWGGFGGRRTTVVEEREPYY
ncbi:MAG TPA: hypothetical protein VE984_02130 [Gaiellaceae bacterium]|nr:hypothetical protein [Gaiellaceae bacterium]